VAEEQPRVPAGSPEGGQFAAKGVQPWGPEDESLELRGAAEAYSRTFEAAAVITEASRSVIRGRGEDSFLDGVDNDLVAADRGNVADRYAQAKLLVEAVRDAPEQERELYRGIKFDRTFETAQERAFKGLKVGDSVEFGAITSFSAVPGIAATYAAGAGSYQIILRGKSKTAGLSGLTSGERITHGKFRVVEVRPGETTTSTLGHRVTYKKTLVIEQEEVF
jgi:hypothetical protein